MKQYFNRNWTNLCAGLQEDDVYINLEYNKNIYACICLVSALNIIFLCNFSHEDKKNLFSFESIWQLIIKLKLNF